MPGTDLPPIQPRVLTAPAVARYLGRSPTWFNEHLAELIKNGFPARVPIINGWDRAAIDAWLAQQNAPRAAGAAKPKGWGAAARG